MGTNAVQKDATARAVSANVQRLRKAQNLGLRALARKLEDVGRPMLHSAVDQIERGTRRVDVDDLVALAAALQVSPATLLMPESALDASFGQSRVLVEWADKAEPVPADWLWGWITAQHALDPENQLAFAGRALPRFRQEILLNEMAQVQKHFQEYVHNRQAEQEGAADGDD